MTDYFKFYELPVSFNPDPAAIKQKFYQFSKLYHPDFYINDSDDKQAEVLELSTLNNKAYQILSDPGKRLHYILELKGVLIEGEHYVLPQSFLMDMMEVNESLMDLQFDPDPVRLTSLKDQVASIAQGITEEISALTNGFDALNLASQQDVLVSVKDLYYRNKYLLRINESIQKAIASA